MLFNLPDLVIANLVFVCEGEKDCINVGNADLFASDGYSIACITSFDGAWEDNQSPKWLEIYNPYFTGRIVVILAHNDASGRNYARTVASGILKYAASVRIVYFDELPEKGDVSDYLESYGREKLEDKITATPFWKGESSDRKDWLVETVEWASTASPQVDWLINGIIQADANGIIAAEPKTGKSLCALDLLLSLSCGEPWLGRHVPRRVRCSYISREDSPLLTKVRVQGFLRGKGIGVDPTGWLWSNTREQLGDFNIDIEDHLKNMAHDLKEHGVEFAVLDVLNRIHSHNENDNTEMVQVVQRISQMGREAGCAIGLVHHVSKENSYTGRFFTRIRGASAIHGWTEWSIGLSLENPGETKLIRKAEFETKAGESCAPISFTIEFGGGNLRLQGVDPRRNVDAADRDARYPYQ